MNTVNKPSLKFLTGFKNRIFFLFLCVALNVSCQSVEPASDEKEGNIQKIIDTNLAFAQKQMDLGQAEQALQTLRPLLTNFPKHAALLNMVGLTYLALSNPSRAKTFFERAYDNENNPGYALNLSSALIAMGAYSKAEKVLETHLKQKKYQYMERFYHNYALTFEKRKQYKKAIQYYTKALDENPSYYLSNYRLGKIYQTLNRKKAALTAYEKSYNSCQVCFEPLHELCLMYIENGEFKKANSLLQKFLANKDLPKDLKKEAKKLLSLSDKMNSE